MNQITASLTSVRRNLGPYELIKLLGAGGMGEVYRARDARLRRDVAIKVLPRDFARDPELLKRLSREARAVGQLNHPNIVAVYDVGSENGSEYVVMELLEGETLGKKLLESGRLTPRKTLDYAVQIARGLAAAHEKNIIHRDLKPDNVFITRDGRVKILDFGLAHQLPNENDLGQLSSRLTIPGTTMGTAAYMSPEQARGLPLDHRTDLFSFGVVLYEMLSGQLPFEADTALETMYAILNSEPRDLRELVPNLPPVLYRVVSHCLEKSPEKRFQTVNDLIFDLENCSEMGWPALTAPALVVAPRKRLRLAAIGAALAVIVALSALALWKWRPPAQPDPSFRRLTFRPTLIQSARFTADGETVVYSASRKWQPLRLNMLRVDRPESHTLPIPDAELASVSRTGEMAVILNAPLLGPQLESYPGGILAEVPVLGGTPRQIADRVILADWSPDGRLAVWRKNEKGTYQLEFPLGHVLHTSSRVAYSMRVSPKGDQIAMNVSVNDQMSDVIVIGLDGSKRTVAGAPVRARGMAWSADGKEVWYATARDAQQVPTMYAVSLDGERRRVMRSPGWPWLHDVAPDGTLLLAITATQGGIIVEDGGPEKANDLSWFDASILADISTDGKHIVFTESWEGVQYKLTVYMRGTDDSAAVRLGEGIALAFSPSKDTVLALRHGPKRRELILLPTGPGKTQTLPNDLDALWAGFLPDGRILINAKTAEGPRMFIQARDGKPPRALTPPGMGIGVINVVGSGAIKPVSPDGRSVLVFDREQRPWLFPLDGSAAKPAPGVLPGDQPAGWSRDGRHIYVYPVLQLPVKVYDVDLVTGERRMLREFTVPDPEGVFRINPVLLMPDGRSFAYGYYRAVSTLYTATGFQ